MGDSWSKGSVPAADNPPVVPHNNIAIGGASVQSNPFNVHTRYIRCHCDAICSILIGPNPIVTTADARMAQNQTEYFAVNPGDMIAVISNV